LSSLRNQLKEKEIEQLIDEEIIITEELTETIALSDADLPTQFMSEAQMTVDPVIEESEDKTHIQESTSSNESAGDKTLINPVAQQEIALMRKKLQEDEAKKLKAEQDKKEEEEKKKALAQQKALEAADDSTQMIKLDSIKHELLNIANEEEEKLKKELVVIEKQKKI